MNVNEELILLEVMQAILAALADVRARLARIELRLAVPEEKKPPDHVHSATG